MEKNWFSHDTAFLILDDSLLEYRCLMIPMDDACGVAGKIFFFFNLKAILTNTWAKVINVAQNSIRDQVQTEECRIHATGILAARD